MNDDALHRLAQQMADTADRGIITSRQALSIVGQATFDAAGVEVVCQRTRWRNHKRVQAALSQQRAT